MIVIGLTGGIATGKSMVASLLKQRGIVVLNSDELAHQSMISGTTVFERIIARFGKGILDDKGEIDRKKLGTIVFADAKLRQYLEKIVHPVVIQQIRTEIEKNSKAGLKMMVVEVPLLFEAGITELFDQIWVVSAEREIQMDRLRRRNQLTEEEARQRILSQFPLNQKEERADLVIYNNTDLQTLENQIDKIIHSLGVLDCKK